MTLRRRIENCLVLVTVLAAVAALAAACVTRPPRAVAAAGRPNIVFVLTDDLATNLVRYMPHVLALEKAGMTFSNYTVTDSLCCPSRSSILTGNYPHDTHVLTNTGPLGGFHTFHRLGEEEHTFATTLSAQGYRTALMGKYLNDYVPSSSLGQVLPYVPPGWSEWDVGGYSGYFGFDYRLNVNHWVQSFGHAPSDYMTTVLDERAQQFIRDSAGAHAPFMLEVATFAPHRPFIPAPQDVGTFSGVRAPRTPAFDRLPTHPPAWLATHRPMSRNLLNFIDSRFRRRVEDVQAVDRMIGHLETVLQETGQARNTFFVFSSDNGYHMGEYRLAPGKLTAFDTDIRVPLVITGPGVAAGAVNPAVVQNIDLAPTFEAIGGAPVAPTVDGRSFLPLLRGRTPADWQTLALIEHHGPDRNPADPDYPPRGSGNPPTYDAIRSATFLYVEYADGGREYYDLVRDPWELHNVVGSLSPGRLAELHRAVTDLHDCHGATACRRAGVAVQA